MLKDIDYAGMTHQTVRILLDLTQFDSHCPWSHNRKRRFKFAIFTYFRMGLTPLTHQKGWHAIR